MGLPMNDKHAPTLPIVTHFDQSVIQTDNQFLKKIIAYLKNSNRSESEEFDLQKLVTKNNDILQDFKRRELNRSNDDFQDISQEDLTLYTTFLNSNNHQKDFTAERILKPLPTLNLTEAQPSPRGDEASSSTSHRRHSHHHHHHSHGSKPNSPRGDKPKKEAEFTDVPDDDQAHKSIDAVEENAALDKFGTAATTTASSSSSASTPPASITTEPDTIEKRSKYKLLASSRIECGMKTAVGIIGTATVVIGAVAFKLIMDYMQQADVSKTTTIARM
jgi:hypothetical protein